MRPAAMAVPISPIKSAAWMPTVQPPHSRRLAGARKSLVSPSVSAIRIRAAARADGDWVEVHDDLVPLVNRGCQHLDAALPACDSHPTAASAAWRLRPC